MERFDPAMNGCFLAKTLTFVKEHPRNFSNAKPAAAEAKGIPTCNKLLDVTKTSSHEIYTPTMDRNRI